VKIKFHENTTIGSKLIRGELHMDILLNKRITPYYIDIIRQMCGGYLNMWELWSLCCCVAEQVQIALHHQL